MNYYSDYDKMYEKFISLEVKFEIDVDSVTKIVQNGGRFRTAFFGMVESYRHGDNLKKLKEKFSVVTDEFSGIIRSYEEVGDILYLTFEDGREENTYTSSFEDSLVQTYDNNIESYAYRYVDILNLVIGKKMKFNIADENLYIKEICDKIELKKR